MSLKSLLTNLKNKFSGEKPDNNPDAVSGPPIASGKVPMSVLSRFLRFRKERQGKVRAYRKRNVPYMGGYRKLRLHRIRMSQLQGIEVANHRRKARETGSMLEHKLIHYPAHRHA